MINVWLQRGPKIANDKVETKPKVAINYMDELSVWHWCLYSPDYDSLGREGFERPVSCDDSVPLSYLTTSAGTSRIRHNPEQAGQVRLHSLNELTGIHSDRSALPSACPRHAADDA
jgi:hypothetical protein